MANKFEIASVAELADRLVRDPDYARESNVRYEAEMQRRFGDRAKWPKSDPKMQALEKKRRAWRECWRKLRERHPQVHAPEEQQRSAPPEPMVRWQLPGQNQPIFVTLQDAAARFRVLTGEEFDVKRWRAIHGLVDDK